MCNLLPNAYGIPKPWNVRVKDKKSVNGLF